MQIEIMYRCNDNDNPPTYAKMYSGFVSTINWLRADVLGPSMQSVQITNNVCTYIVTLHMNEMN